MKCPKCQAENEATASTCASCGQTLSPSRSKTSSLWGELSPGTIFHSRYEILCSLGRGGMGMVYKAHDHTLDETVAIKVLRPDYGHDPQMAERFKSEIKLARKVRHKNVCTIHDFGHDQGLYYISMEFIEGVDLKRVMKSGTLRPEVAFEVAIQVAEGLQAVHDAGIIHRDLKTANLMRDAQGVVRLMDFGVAKKFGAGATVTATGQVIGTPEYMSPEQAQGHKIDFRSDVYALGILIYELFSGRVPFRGDTPISTILKHINDSPPLTGPQTEMIPSGVLSILHKALEKQPDKRYSSANEVTDALRRARASPQGTAMPPTAVQEAPTVVSDDLAGAAKEAAVRRQRSYRPYLWILALAAIAVAAVGAYLVYQSTESETTGTGTSQAAVGLPPSSSPEATVAPTTIPSPVTTPSTVPVSTVAASTSSVRPTTTTPVASTSVTPTTSSVVPATTSVLSTTVPPTTSVEASPVTVGGIGMLQVGIVPWAEIRVDGELIGTTPLDKIPLSAGTHVVRIRHPDYDPLEREITIRPDVTEKLVVNLPKEGTRRQ